MIGNSAPLPCLVRRARNATVYANALAIGVPDVVARVLAGRDLSPDTDLKAFLEAKLSSLDPPDALADIEPAARRIAVSRKDTASQRQWLIVFSPRGHGRRC